MNHTHASHAMHTHAGPPSGAVTSVTLDLGGLLGALSGAGAEAQLQLAPGVKSVATNVVSGSVTVYFDQTLTSPDELAERLRQCGFHCRGERSPEHLCLASAKLGGNVRTPEDHAQQARPAHASALAAHDETHALYNHPQRRIVMLNIKTVSCAVGIWAAVNFVVCVLFGLLTPQYLHMHKFLELILPGFQWISGWAFLLGLAESFFFGAYAAIVFVLIYNWLAKRFAGQS